MSSPALACPPASSHLLLLARVNALQAWRRLKSVRQQSRLLTTIILLFVVGYLVISFWLFHRAYGLFQRFPVWEPF